jgi:hypothetical protein
MPGGSFQSFGRMLQFRSMVTGKIELHFIGIHTSYYCALPRRDAFCIPPAEHHLYPKGEPTLANVA